MMNTLNTKSKSKMLKKFKLFRRTVMPMSKPKTVKQFVSDALVKQAVAPKPIPKPTG